ncbi:YfiT family bacillithiol transferase [Sphingobacterium sp. HJSM2_6]|uniref:YfiT family bacillithiol transferase n=1 Tax=Sphingobacterium sp. HJSM2_6 TaxID=3366264 RepID=UPI003BBF0E82
MTENLAYPIGHFNPPSRIDQALIDLWIQQIASFPGKLTQELHGLSPTDLLRKHRPGGWTIQQLVHHCADSHMNSFIRFKLALTEENPSIKPYEEHLWAELADVTQIDIASSLSILTGLHQRWELLLRSLDTEELDRTFVHPATQKMISLKTNIGIYAWHAEHHLAHLKNAKLMEIY